MGKVQLEKTGFGMLELTEPGMHELGFGLEKELTELGMLEAVELEML